MNPASRSFHSSTPIVRRRSSSKVVIEQVNKEWDCVKDMMDAYCAEIQKLKGHFEGIEFQHVPRSNNITADVLSKLGSRRALVPADVFVQDLHKPLLTQNVHLAPNTQQAEQAGFTHAESHETCQSIFPEN
jgi:hypothetical protein